MKMEILNESGRYYQVKHRKGTPPSLTVKGGDVHYWVKDGPADGDEKKITEGTVYGGEGDGSTVTVALPRKNEWKIYSIFVEGLNEGTRIYLDKKETHILNESGKKSPLPGYDPLTKKSQTIKGKSFKHCS